MQIVTTTSAYSVAETVDRLSDLLNKKGIRIFATINHAQGARESGLELRDEILLIFGDAKVGTFLMQEQQTIGIDLPLKILVWQDVNKVIQVTYENPVELGKMHGIKQQQDILQKMQQLLVNLIEQASKI